MLRDNAIILFLLCLTLYVRAYSIGRQVPLLAIAPRNDFSLWLTIQPNVSIGHILQNIGTEAGLFPGVVVASTSSFEPNYRYQWVRDAALTMDALVTNLADDGYTNTKLAAVIEDYIMSSYILQRTSNPSGRFPDGLGEPKFNLDNTPFTEQWGRPQNDGPALRSVCIMNYLGLVDTYHDGLLLSGNSTNEVYEAVVKPDLEYITQHWNVNGFDLWEELEGPHFFTSLVQLKALKKGALVATHFKDYKFARQLRAKSVQLESFIRFESGFVDTIGHQIYENPGYSFKLGLDMASVIGSLITHAHSTLFDNNTDIDMPFDVDDPYVLNSFHRFVMDQNMRYPLNHDKSKRGISIGRYPNDVYDGVGTSLGNPWFLSNAYASMYLYRRLYKVLTGRLDFVIYNETYGFYRDLVIDPRVIDEDYLNKELLVVPYNTEKFRVLANALFSLADSFLKIVLAHITDEGELSEQFNRETGFSQGAKNLTWSYSSVWSAIRERQLIEVMI